MRIELTGVSKSFGRTRALSAIDLSIARGARVALLGPNGSGKTTLTRAIMGLVRVDGDIRIDGEALADRMAIAPRLAYVPQIAPQMTASVREIVRATCELRGVGADGVTAIAADLGLDLAAIEARALRDLSGGMRHKVLLALALAMPAQLVVLDEPTASLDAAARARFLARFAALPADTTVILCSHRLDELRTMIDHVIALADGRVVFDGPADGYLARRLSAVLELRVRGDDPGWLAARGFAPGIGGWWSRAVSPRDKLELVPGAVAALGDALEDVVVRDADRLEVDARAA